MGRFIDDRPKFEEMPKEELIALLDSFRERLRHCEDSGDFCIYTAAVLKVDLGAHAYERDE